jgi:hypothetical protein
MLRKESGGPACRMPEGAIVESLTLDYFGVDLNNC